MINDFLTPEKFMKTIEQMIVEKKINYLEAILLFCDENNLEVEEVVPVIKRTMKEKVKLAAQEAGLMRKESTLPI